jgi:hypothetical protein
LRHGDDWEALRKGNDEGPEMKAHELLQGIEVEAICGWGS